MKRGDLVTVNQELPSEVLRDLREVPPIARCLVTNVHPAESAYVEFVDIVTERGFSAAMVGVEWIQLDIVASYRQSFASPLRTIEIAEIKELLDEFFTTDGEHHKVWYAEEIAKILGIEPPEHQPGIAP